MPEMIGVLVVPAGVPSHMSLVDRNDNEALKKLIGGGNLKRMSLPGGIVMFCDEDGERKGLPTNFILTGEGTREGLVVGPVIFARSEPPDLVNLTDNDVISIRAMLMHPNTLKPLLQE